MTKPEVVGYRIVWPHIGTDPQAIDLWMPQTFERTPPRLATCIDPLIRLSDYDTLLAERDELRTALQTERDRYFREVYGLNNEGDPIGGDPAGGYVNQIAMLREALAQTDALASARLAENERLHNALAEGEQLISGDLVGLEWKQACAAFLRRARAALSQQAKP